MLFFNLIYIISLQVSVLVGFYKLVLNNSGLVPTLFHKELFVLLPHLFCWSWPCYWRLWPLKIYKTFKMHYFKEIRDIQYTRNTSAPPDPPNPTATHASYSILSVKMTKPMKLSTVLAMLIRTCKDNVSLKDLEMHFPLVFIWK